MNAQVTIETINPKMAVELTKNKLPEQRNLRPGNVSQLASEMNRGAFRLSCDAICLVKGRLANGQHRLEAVIRSGKSAPFIILRTNDEEIYKITDAGRPRSVGDGLVGTSHASLIASAARLVLAYDFGIIGHSGYNMNTKEKSITRSGIFDYIQQNREKLAEQSKFVFSLYLKTGVVGTTITTAFLHIASRLDEEKARAFIANVYLGESIDASKDFRDRMIKHSNTRSRLRQAHVFGLLIKAWNSYKNGTRPGLLQFKDTEEFPEI